MSASPETKESEERPRITRVTPTIPVSELSSLGTIAREAKRAIDAQKNAFKDYNETTRALRTSMPTFSTISPFDSYRDTAAGSLGDMTATGVSSMNLDVEEILASLKKQGVTLDGVRKEIAAVKAETKNDIEKLKTDYEKSLQEQAKKFEQGISKSTEKFSGKTKELSKEFQTKFENKVESGKLNIIESLALFAAFFTFVSTSVQIFTKVSNLFSAMCFMILMLGLLGMFTLLIDVIVRNNFPSEKDRQGNDWRLHKYLASLFFILVAGGLFLSYKFKIPLNVSNSPVAEELAEEKAKHANTSQAEKETGLNEQTPLSTDQQQVVPITPVKKDVPVNQGEKIP